MLVICLYNFILFFLIKVPGWIESLFNCFMITILQAQELVSNIT